MGEGLGGHAAAGLAPEAVVADGGGGAQALLGVPGLQQGARAADVVPQTPARQSACSSRRTDSSLPSAAGRRELSRRTWSDSPSRYCT